MLRMEQLAIILLRNRSQFDTQKLQLKPSPPPPPPPPAKQEKPTENCLVDTCVQNCLSFGILSIRNAVTRSGFMSYNCRWFPYRHFLAYFLQ